MPRAWIDVFLISSQPLEVVAQATQHRPAPKTEASFNHGEEYGAEGPSVSAVAEVQVSLVG